RYCPVSCHRAGTVSLVAHAGLHGQGRLASAPCARGRDRRKSAGPGVGDAPGHDRNRSHSTHSRASRGKRRIGEMRLQGKVAVVTGAARGIGLAIAREFVAEGARVALADWLADDVTAAAATLGPG